MCNHVQHLSDIVDEKWHCSISVCTPKEDGIVFLHIHSVVSWILVFRDFVIRKDKRFCYQEGTRFIYDVQSRNVEHFCWQAYDSVDPVYSKLLVKEVVPVFGPFAKFLACGRNQWIRFRKSGCIGCCSMRRLWNVAFAIIYRGQQYFGKVYTFTWLWCKPPWPRAFWSFGRRIC